ncbi:MAG: hypothetical protein HY078_06290 [Elusimicrobia bacterium]|nr:hypothetical protein [Elusimicrobiota bacterium]
MTKKMFGSLAVLALAVFSWAAPAPELTPAVAIREAGRLSVPAYTAIPVAARGADACARAERQVAEGDVVVLERNDGFFGAVAKASNSWAGHVGIALKNARGEWRVYESTAPKGRSNTLCGFVQGSHGRVALKRVRGLDAGKVAGLKAYVGRASNLELPYDYAFNLRARGSLFCSKFVYLAFQSVGLEVGRVQTFRKIHAEYRGAGKEQLFKTFEAHFKKLGHSTFPWEQETVTPGSQLADARHSTIQP